MEMAPQRNRSELEKRPTNLLPTNDSRIEDFEFTRCNTIWRREKKDLIFLRAHHFYSNKSSTVKHMRQHPSYFGSGL